MAALATMGNTRVDGHRAITSPRYKVADQTGTKVSATASSHRSMGTSFLETAEEPHQAASFAGAVLQHPIPWPSEHMAPRWTPVSFDSPGSFGEVWSAFDTKLRKHVKIKLLYMTLKNKTSGTSSQTSFVHMTWSRIGSNEKLRQDAMSEADGCYIAKELQKRAHLDPVGASRCAKCFEERVIQTQSGVDPDTPLFLVLEDGGEMNMKEWVRDMPGQLAPSTYVRQALGMYKQVLQALYFMTMDAAPIKYTHHDLKPANVVIKDLGQGKQVVKVIDFGAAHEINEENAQRGDITCTAIFSPPELWTLRRGGFDPAYPSSFDVYSSAMVLDELMTGCHTAVKLQDQTIRNCMEKYITEHRMPSTSARERCSKQVMLSTKKVGGTEAQMTPEDIQRLLMSKAYAGKLQAGNSVYSDAVGDIMDEYMKVQRNSGWMPEFFARIMAYKAVDRPTPAMVLSHPLVRGLEVPLDPDYNYQAVRQRLVSQAGSTSGSSRSATPTPAPPSRSSAVRSAGFHRHVHLLLAACSVSLAIGRRLRPSRV